jgi:tryptophan-rich sensory protein
VLNFAALGIGGFFTGKGVPSEWYNNLNKAPWSPPGWVFGFAWTTIMICFAVYMSYAWTKVSDLKLLVILFAVQWILNIAWNPAFFYFHQVTVALIIISLLTILVGYFLVAYWSDLKIYSLLIMPYFVWLLIATSLNAYILVRN